MSKKEAPLHALEQFLPPHTFVHIASFFKTYTIHLTISKERNSILGDYRNPTPQYTAHRISINGNLNPYSFLITLLHELAHLLTYVQYKHSVNPHGSEWKQLFAQLLHHYIHNNTFPKDIAEALLRYQSNVKASTCTDPHLYRILKRYDSDSNNHIFVEALPQHSTFQTKDGRQFERLEKRRTRYRCKEITTGHIYLFPGIAEVTLVS
jgi:SprT protein